MRGPWLSAAALTLALGMLFGLWKASGPAAESAPPAQAAPDGPTIAAFAKGGCAACHAIPGIPSAVGQVGPDLSAIGAEAAARVSGLDAEAYLRQSILMPNAFIAPGCPTGECPENVMPANIGQRLSAGELTLIIDYLLSLTGEGVAMPEAYVLVPIEIVRPAETALPAFVEPPRSYEDAQVLLGKYLFFDARLSGNASTSCATCHRPEAAWTDGQALSEGYPSTRYFRNTPTVMNAVYLDRLYWDGRMDGADMPTLVRDHLTEAHFMNSDGRLMVERVKQVPEYVRLFQDAFDQGPSFGGVLNALAAYVGSLNSAPAPYDRYRLGETDALSPEAQAGLALFEGKAGCAACHSGPAFSDGRFYALGVPENQEIWADPLRHITFRRFFRLFGTPNYRALNADPGHYALTLRSSDRGAFRTAPLRELAHTAPYMHNGVFSTLEEVVAFYTAGGGEGNPALGPLRLTDTEIAQLVAFLESLSSELPSVEALSPPDYQLRTLGENR